MTGFAIAALIVDVLRAYAAAGALVAAAFLVIGLDRHDPAARGSYLFRPLLLPGLVLLWPWVLLRWRALEAARRRDG